MRSIALGAKNKIAPYGIPDLALQLGLLLFCYLGYQMVRGIADHSVANAFWHTGQIINLEQSLGVFVEPDIQSWARGQDVIISLANWMYLNSHYLVSGGAILWVYHRHRDRFSQVRNSFLCAMLLALLGYLLFPAAPPRLMPEWGFYDSVAQATGVDASSQSGSALINMYAAVPSMHFGFALLVGGWMYKLSKHQTVRYLWTLYPLLVLWVVIATANHFLFDALVGGLVAVTSAWLSAMLERQRTRSSTS